MVSLGRPTVWSLLVALRYQLIAAFRWPSTASRSSCPEVCAIAAVIPIANKATIVTNARRPRCLRPSLAVRNTLRLSFSDLSSSNFNMILIRSVMLLGWAGRFAVCRTGKQSNWVFARTQLHYIAILALELRIHQSSEHRAVGNKHVYRYDGMSQLSSARK